MIHETTIINGTVTFGHRVTVEPYCVLGSDHGPLHIPDQAVIRAHTVIYGGSEYGPGLQTGHHATLRAGVTAGPGLAVGTNSILEGGAEIGDYVRIRSRCEMTLARLGHFVNLYTNSCITDNRMPPLPDKRPVTVGDGAILCAHALIVAGVTIGPGAYIGGHATVHKDVPAGAVWEAAHGIARGRRTRDLRLDGLCHPGPWWELERYPPAVHGRVLRLRERLEAL